VDGMFIGSNMASSILKLNKQGGRLRSSYFAGSSFKYNFSKSTLGITEVLK
jgi:hypothetical protein